MNPTTLLRVLDLATVVGIGLLYARIWVRMRRRTRRQDRLTRALAWQFAVMAAVWGLSPTLLLALRTYAPDAANVARWALRVAIWTVLWRTNTALSAEADEGPDPWALLAAAEDRIADLETQVALLRGLRGE